MADINSKFEIGVTTGPIRGSRKVHVGAKSGSGVRVAMREIQLESGEEPVGTLDAGQPPDEQHDWARGRKVVERPGVGTIQNGSSGFNSRCYGRELVRSSNPGGHERFANTLADGHQRGGMTGENTLDYPDEARGQR